MVVMIDENRNFFFGAHDLDWAPVIVDMMSRKLDKLCVDNFSFPEYLSKDSADTIREVRLDRIH